MLRPRHFAHSLRRDLALEALDHGVAVVGEVLPIERNPFYVDALKRVNAIRRLFAYRTYTDHEGMRRHIRDHLRLLDLIAERRMTDAAAYETASCTLTQGATRIGLLFCGQ
jgi:DNA-binding GntR family transcriptional regulator